MFGRTPSPPLSQRSHTQTHTSKNSQAPTSSDLSTLMSELSTYSSQQRPSASSTTLRAIHKVAWHDLNTRTLEGLLAEMAQSEHSPARKCAHQALGKAARLFRRTAGRHVKAAYSFQEHLTEHVHATCVQAHSAVERDSGEAVTILSMRKRGTMDTAARTGALVCLESLARPQCTLGRILICASCDLDRVVAAWCHMNSCIVTPFSKSLQCAELHEHLAYAGCLKLVAALAMLRSHAHAPQCRECYESCWHFYTVTDVCTGGGLSDAHAAQRIELGSQPTARIIVQQLGQILLAAHALGIVGWCVFWLDLTVSCQVTQAVTSNNVVQHACS